MATLATWLILCNKATRAGGLHTNGLIFVVFRATSKRCAAAAADADAAEATAKEPKTQTGCGCVCSSIPPPSISSSACSPFAHLERGLRVAHLDEFVPRSHLRNTPDGTIPWYADSRFAIQDSRFAIQKLRFSQRLQCSHKLWPGIATLDTVTRCDAARLLRISNEISQQRESRSPRSNTCWGTGRSSTPNLTFPLSLLFELPL